MKCLAWLKCLWCVHAPTQVRPTTVYCSDLDSAIGDVSRGHQNDSSTEISLFMGQLRKSRCNSFVSFTYARSSLEGRRNRGASVEIQRRKKVRTRRDETLKYREVAGVLILDLQLRQQPSRTPPLPICKSEKKNTL